MISAGRHLGSGALLTAAPMRVTLPGLGLCSLSGLWWCTNYPVLMTADLEMLIGVKISGGFPISLLIFVPSVPFTEIQGDTLVCDRSI